MFWFTLGVGAAVYVTAKVRTFASQATPQAIGKRVGESAVGVGDSVRGFSGRVRVAMAERETELRELLNLPD
jgi:hypothetical protein